MISATQILEYSFNCFYFISLVPWALSTWRKAAGVPLTSIKCRDKECWSCTVTPPYIFMVKVKFSPLQALEALRVARG
jgi:hypothetical protein